MRESTTERTWISFGEGSPRQTQRCEAQTQTYPGENDGMVLVLRLALSKDWISGQQDSVHFFDFRHPIEVIPFGFDEDGVEFLADERLAGILDRIDEGNCNRGRG
jgi:hypothetical protein